MEEKIVQLNEDDLDNIVGGAFNQSAIDRLGLEITMNRRGESRLTADVDAKNTSNPQVINTWRQMNDNLYESQLRNIVERYDQVSISAKTTSGEMKTLTKSDISDLLSS